jgi:hypothetical protein
MPNEAKNVDDILIPREQNMINNEQAHVQPALEFTKLDEKPEEIPEKKEKIEENPENLDKKVELEEKKEEKPDNLEEKPSETPKSSSENPIDEYGNPLEKTKMYSEDEVQRMIRERLSRGRYADNPDSQALKEEAKDFKADPNSEESWEAQLEEFIDKTIQKREQKLTQKQWQHEEKERQAEFESKFSTGMNKYEDFREVVSGQPITDSMMLATRSLENPAAFIYGAAKLHPKELERISKITDPFAQASEIGRLHEKMVKNKNAMTKASKPLETPKGDIPIRNNMRPSIDNLIEQHGRQKQQLRRR